MSKMDQIRALREAQAEAEKPKSKIIKSLEQAVEFAKGDESQGRKTTVIIPDLKSHPECPVCKRNREMTKLRMRKRRQEGKRK